MFSGISAALGGRPYAAMPAEDDDQESYSAVDYDARSVTADCVTDTESQSHGEYPQYHVYYTRSTTGSILEKKWDAKSVAGRWVKVACPVLKSWQDSLYVFYGDLVLTGVLEALPTRHKVPPELKEMFNQYRMVKEQDVIPIDGNIYRYMAFFAFGTLDTRYQQDCTEAAVEAAREQAVEDGEDPEVAAKKEIEKERAIDFAVVRASQEGMEDPGEAGKREMRKQMAIEYAMQRAQQKGKDVEKARRKEIEKQRFIETGAQSSQDESERAKEWAVLQAEQAGEDPDEALEAEDRLQKDLAEFAADEDPTDEIFRLPRPCYQFILLHIGLYAVILLQVVTPICLLWVYVRNFWKGFRKSKNKNGDFTAWKHYDEMDWMVILVGYVFLLAIQLSTFFKLVNDSRSGTMVRKLARGLNEMGEPVYVTWLILDAFINSFVAITVSLAAFFLIYKTRSVDDIILNSVGLLFLNNVDDVASDFQFLDSVWDSQVMGRYLIAVANTKARGKMHDREVAPAPLRDCLFRLYQRLPEYIYGIAKLTLIVCLMFGVASIVLLASRHAPARDLPGDGPPPAPAKPAPTASSEAALEAVLARHQRQQQQGSGDPVHVMVHHFHHYGQTAFYLSYYYQYY